MFVDCCLRFVDRGCVLFVVVSCVLIVGYCLVCFVRCSLLRA